MITTIRWSCSDTYPPECVLILLHLLGYGGSRQEIESVSKGLRILLTAVMSVAALSAVALNAKFELLNVITARNPSRSLNLNT